MIDELAKKRKEKSIDEVSDIIAEMYLSTEKLCDWAEKHKNDEFFKTGIGKQLMEHILDICGSHAYASLDLSNIYLQDLGMI